MGQNKAVTIDREIAMPPLTDKDRHAINIGLNKSIQISPFLLQICVRCRRD